MTGYMGPRMRRTRNHTPQALLKVIERRDPDRACAWHTKGLCDPETRVPQHRQGGMGGRADKHRPSNVVWLCSEVNGLIESNARYQARARARGIKISGFSDPRMEPIDHALHGPVLLDDNGGVHLVHGFAPPENGRQ